VDEEGKISDIRSLSKNGYGTEEEVLRAMRFSPDWIPAKQNGRNITFLRKQPITFVIAE
jgi:protein TonB